MTAAEDRARELAAERYPAYPCADAIDHRSREAFVVGYVTGRTITAEQVETAAMTMHNLTVDTLWGECGSEKEADMSVIRAAFKAAGFYVEGGE